MIESTTAGNAIAVTPNGVIGIGAWYFIVAWFNHTIGANGTVYVQVNDGIVYSTALAAAKNSGNGSYVAFGDLGSTVLAYGAMDGGVDESGFWNIALSSAQRTALYAGGAGLPYASFTL